jgi:DNA-binding NarL/FixJ family response regulator
VLRDVGAPEIENVLGMVGYTAAMIAQRTIDESIRVRWFRGPTGRALTELVGESDIAGADSDSAPEDADQALLQGLVRGQTDTEIAVALGVDEDEVVRRLGGLFAKIGASSRAEATAFAFRERVL